MAEIENTTPLLIHTLETLCDELVSGRGVIIDDEGTLFQFTKPQERSIFEWYRMNRMKWAGRVMKPDVEAIADSIKNSPPDLPSRIIEGDRQQNKVYHLKSIRAHRFAGIHKYKEPNNPPDQFYFDFEKPFYVIEGMNGSGKTSLLSAICWCLSGFIYRSQRAPEHVNQYVGLEIDNEGQEINNVASTYNMTPITPVPSKKVLESLGGVNVLLDTWVELEFEDEGRHEITIRRSISRTPRGKIIIEEPDLSSLNIDPMALAIGTKMTGIIPYIQLEETSDLGQAVAAMTGLKPLKDLSQHAVKVQNKLKKDFTKERRDEIVKFKKDFHEKIDELQKLIDENPFVRPKDPLPEVNDEILDKKLDNLTQHYVELQAASLSKCKMILGESFNAEDENQRKDLLESAKPALGQIDKTSLARLPSAMKLKNLGNWEEKNQTAVEELIDKLESEADELARLDKQPKRAVRLRLYARIAGWIKDHPEQIENINDCPICDRKLNGIVDSQIGGYLLDHIKSHLEGKSEYLEKTIGAWEQSAISSLKKLLPANIQELLFNDLYDNPSCMISKALCIELFESPIFSKSLSPLKASITELCKRELEKLQPFDEPVECTLPECYGNRANSLRNFINRTKRAIEFARWRKENEKECRTLFDSVVGTIQEPRDNRIEDISDVSDCSLSVRLQMLAKIIESTSPIERASKLAEKLKVVFDSIKNKEDRIIQYNQTAEAIGKLIQIQELVEKQVTFLMDKLFSDTERWREKIYSPSFVGAPEISNTDVSTDGKVHIDATANGTKASAKHISNASDLKATLLSFLLAFWNYFSKVRGGLSLLLLDDLQELFDRPNRRLIANCLPELLKMGGRPIITTNDHTFGNQVFRSFKNEEMAEKIGHLVIHPLKSIRDHIALGKFSEAIEEKRRIFESPENQNEAQPARDYINNLRIYLENKLTDLFDSIHPGLPDKPTLSDLFGAIRARRNVGQDLYQSQIFLKLISDPALAQNSSFLYLINESHHGRDNNITFRAVWEVKEDCIRVRKLVDSIHEEYELWMRRDPQIVEEEMPNAPQAIKPSLKDVPVMLDLAAFTAESPASETSIDTELFSGDSLENCAIYKINTHNFGFSGYINCKCIVDLSEGHVPDSSLVVALHGNNIYARRLHRNEHYPQIIVLSSDAENPLNRPPTIILPANEVRLLKVIGIVFSDDPIFPRPSTEAVLVNDADFIEKVEAIFHVRGDSALPLVLPQQMVLGGKNLMSRDIGESEGSLVAVSTSLGSAFKKIGKPFPGAPHIRQFDSIGGIGETLIVRLENVDDSYSDVPLLHTARIVLGVLYE